MTRILIADDHAVFRWGVKEIVSREFEDVVFGEAKDGLDVLEQVQSKVWDLLILDLEMPGRSGLEVLATLRHVQPRLNVLVTSLHSEEQYGKRVLAAGARGFVSKESRPEELTKAIRKVLAGGRYVSAMMAEKLAKDLYDPNARLAHESLSDREFEILRLIAAGKTVSQIAEECRLAATTVSTYRTRILEKMRMSTTADMIRYVIENHLAN